MKIYLVGGAVRDKLMGLTCCDRDFVVVGSTREELLSLGYKPVGSDFPVFLHPKTNEEYALARVERKIGKGHTGFNFDSTQSVTLEEDLLRRDLTINAIASDDDGNIYDPFNGVSDLKSKMLRHVSAAFVEDPLRVLRVARFAAKFHHLGFKVASETLELMKKISASGELNLLSSERVWLETEKSLNTNNPQVYFNILKEVNALSVLFPEIDALFGVPQPAIWHPEIDTGIHCMMALKQASLITEDPITRFATLVHDLGKAKTDQTKWPKHFGHEELGISVTKNMCERLKVPKEYISVAIFVVAYHTKMHKFKELTPNSILEIFSNGDIWRKPKRLIQFIDACQADSQGRLGLTQAPYPQAKWLKDAFELAKSINIQNIIAEGYQGEEIKKQIHNKKIEVLTNFCQNLQ